MKNHHDGTKNDSSLWLAVLVIALGAVVTVSVETSVNAQADHEAHAREFVAAFNTRNIEAMLGAVDENVQWLTVNEAKVTIETDGKNALRLVRPGGKLAITTWGPRFFEPASTAFWNSIQAVRPDLYKGFNSWDRISDPGAVRALLAGAGVEDAEVVAEAGACALSSWEDWWPMVLGTGYRGTVEQLDADGR